MKQFLEKTIRWLLVGSFFTPLFLFPAIWTNFIFPFIVPKIVFFRSLVLLMLAGYLILLSLDSKKYKMKTTRLTTLVVAFLVSLTVSTFIGVDWYKSMWDNHERMLGLFTLTHYIIYYVIATTIIKTHLEWRILLRWFLGLGSIVMLLGLYQKSHPEILLGQNNARVSATLGNAIYFAGYGLFLGFVGVYGFFQEEKKHWKYLSLALGLLGFYGIFLSSTRGTLLGLLVGTAVVLGLYVWKGNLNPKWRKIILGVVAIGLVLLGILFSFRRSPTVYTIPALGQLLNAGHEIQERSPRLMAWGIAIDAWKENPIFGWGPNNYYYAFNKYYLPEFLEHGWGETWFDNAHNVILNTLAVQGLVGLGIYLALFVTSIVLLIKAFNKKKIDSHTTFLSIGFLVAHLIHNIFVFENPTSYLYFFFFLAFINSITNSSGSEPEKQEKNVSKPFPWLKAGAIVAITLFLISYTNIQPAQANMSTLQTIQALYTGKDPVSLYQQTELMNTPHIDDVRNDLARTIGSLLPQYAQAKAQKEIQPLFQMAYDDMKKNQLLHPLDIRVHLQAAQLAQLGAQFYNQPQLLKEAESVLDQALLASPKRQQIQYMLAVLSLQQGNIGKAESLLKESIANDPKIDEGWWRLAYVYAALGDKKQMEETFANAKAQGVEINESRKNSILDVLNQSASSTTSR